MTPEKLHRLPLFVSFVERLGFGYFCFNGNPSSGSESVFWIGTACTAREENWEIFLFVVVVFLDILSNGGGVGRDFQGEVPGACYFVCFGWEK